MSIQIRRKHLTKKAVKLLTAIQDSAAWVESTSIRRRMGANGMKNPSMYKTWKWYKIPRPDKADIIDQTPNGIWDKTFLFFFRKYDAGVGLLDRMNNWVGTKNTASFLCVALGKHQQIIIDGELFMLEPGDSITFNITHEHEVPKVKEDNLWAIWMIVE
jgi:hypothetical protein